MRTLLASSLLLVVATACVGSAEVRQGPAHALRPVNVVLAPAACGSVENLCTDQIVEGVNAYVASELRFAGFTVIDAVKLAMAARTDETADEHVRAFGERVLRAANPRQHGQIFADMSPTARGAILSQAKAEGFVTASVQIATPDGLGPGRVNTVVIRLGAGPEDELVWVSRCSAESGLFPDIAQAVDDAAQCALTTVLRHRQKPDEGAVPAASDGTTESDSSKPDESAPPVE